MPALTYSNSAFVTLTVISSSVMNAFFTDITTWANTTKLDYLNLQTAGVRASNISSQAATAGQVLVADGAGAATFSSISTSSSNMALNLSLTASVGSSLLTVAVKTAAAADATSSTPIRIGFRNSTLATGTYLDRSITAALSVNTVAVGCTLGLTSAVNQYIYVYAIDNAGTVELALAGSGSFDEGTRYSTTAINGSSTNSLVLYSTSARSNVAIRLLGRLQSNQVTSGTYATAISEIALTPFKIYLAPTIQTFTSSTGTYTTPTNAVYLRVRLVGAGGGGAGSGTSGQTAGGTGGTTTFGTSLLTGNGGVGGGATSDLTGGGGGTATISTPAIGSTFTGGHGGGAVSEGSTAVVFAGAVGGASMFGGNGGSQYQDAGTAGFRGGGGGGGGVNAVNGYASAAGGGGGGVDAIIPSPSATYAYAVGAAGTAGNAGSSGVAGGAGGAGYIEVTEYYH